MKASLRLPCAAVAVVALCASAAGQQQRPEILTPSGTLPLLDSYLESLRQQSGIPGMSAAIVRDGSIIWEKGYGYRDVAARIPATPDTPYLVGDLSGTLAATLLLQCVEERRLTLDEPVGAHGLTQPEPEATLRGLLTHAAPDGSKGPFLYSPERYANLTALTEWCAPQPYRKSVAHRILDRLAMIDSVPGTDLKDPNLELPDGLFDPADIEKYRHTLESLAVPYKVDGRKRADRTDVPLLPMTAANGLVSTVRDLAKFDMALVPEPPVLLLPGTLDAAWTPAIGRDGGPMPTGLGWFVQYYNGDRLVWHFGYVPNAYSSLLLKIPSRNLTFILLANSDGLSAPFQLSSGDVTRSLFAAVFLKLTS
jgi:CubicO group peptidase (beta-lactamase class C family)